MNKYQKRMFYISMVALISFFVLSIITSNWNFLLLSLPAVFLNLMYAFFAKNSKHIKNSTKSILGN